MPARSPRVAVPPWPAFLIPVITDTFEALKISVSLWFGGTTWHTIRRFPNIVSLEAEHGVAQERWMYNERIFTEVQRTQKLVLGEHLGFRDLFVPVLDASGVRSVIVAGPFLTKRPTSADILERWFTLTNAHGRLADPSFAEYVALTLATLTLDETQLGLFETLLVHFARLMEGPAVPNVTLAELEVLKDDLEHARFVDNCSSRVRDLVNERMAWTWATEDAVDGLAAMGLARPPQHVVVGLMSGRPGDPDPIDQWIRRDAFQRACAAMAKRRGELACGRVGDHGVTFLLDAAGSEAKVRAKLAEVVHRASQLARRFGLRLHAGTGGAIGSEGLPARYRAALWAAEKALSRGLSVVHGEPRPEHSPNLLRRLRAELAQNVARRPDLLLPRFDQYVEAVLTHSGYRIEPARAHLSAAIERLTEPLLASGVLEEKSSGELYAAIDRSVDDARTIATLVEPYRRAVADIENILQRPIVARHDRATQRAVRFMREHLAEPLTLAQVARVAGFAPDYFSRLFKRDQGMSFQSHLQELRLGRAREMLAGSALSVERVAHLCGLRSRGYFHRAFRGAVGMTPAAFRERQKRPAA